MARSRRVCVFVAAVLTAAASTTAGPLLAAPQNPRDRAGVPVRSGTASIAGRVLLATEGDPTPVRRARVTAHDTVSGFARTTDTDTDGRFRFDSLPAGSYRIRADKAGVVPSERAIDRSLMRGAPVELKDGQSATVDIPMQRGGALEGRLVSENGEPAVNVVVSAVRIVHGRYGRRPVPVRQARTDDLGRFRVHTLPSGDYYIEAAVDPLDHARDLPLPGERPSGLARTYYPGTPEVGSAQTVAIGAGQQVTALDFTIGSVRLARVAGRVADSAGRKPLNAAARLQRVGAPPGEVRGLMLPGDSGFEFRAVPPGEYWLMGIAVSPPGAPEFAVRRLTVAGQDQSDLVVSTSKGAAIAGHVEVVPPGGPVPSGVRVVAHETEFELPSPQPSGAIGPGPGGVVDATGTFAFTSLFGPRLLRVEGAPAAWALREIRLGDRDITDVPVDFRGADQPLSVRVVMTSQTAVVGGVVRTAGGQLARHARVVVFPDDPKRRTAYSRFVRSAETGADGRYTIAGLLPGKYYVAAIEQVDETAWEDPDVLARLQAVASSVTVAPSERLTVGLTLQVRR